MVNLRKDYQRTATRAAWLLNNLSLLREDQELLQKYVDKMRALKLEYLWVPTGAFKAQLRSLHQKRSVEEHRTHERRWMSDMIDAVQKIEAMKLSDSDLELTEEIVDQALEDGTWDSRAGKLQIVLVSEYPILVIG